MPRTGTYYFRPGLWNSGGVDADPDPTLKKIGSGSEPIKKWIRIPPNHIFFSFHVKVNMFYILSRYIKVADPVGDDPDPVPSS